MQLKMQKHEIRQYVQTLRRHKKPPSIKNAWAAYCRDVSALYEPINTGKALVLKIDALVEKL